MPKPHTFPTLYDDLKTVSISFLTKYGYLKPNQWQSGTITWSSNGNKTGSISIQVNTQSEQPYIELDYKCNEAPIKYRVQLVSAPSNLGKGVVWYFVCPETGKRCRKLYLGNQYFLHRLAFNGALYENQKRSKKERLFNQTFGVYFSSDDLYYQINKKNFKRRYYGIPTKKYLKLIHKIQKMESVSFDGINRYLNH